jgi:hypothetical protein
MQLIVEHVQRTPSENVHFGQAKNILERQNNFQRSRTFGSVRRIEIKADTPGQFESFEQQPTISTMVLPKFLPAEALPIVTFVGCMCSFSAFMIGRHAMTSPDIMYAYVVVMKNPSSWYALYSFRKSTTHDFLKPETEAKTYNKLYHVSHFKE